MSLILALVCFFAAAIAVGVAALLASLVPAIPGWLLDILKLGLLVARGAGGMTALKCESCNHWQALDRATSFAAPCAKGAYPGRVSFDMSCTQHSSLPQQAQSEARGGFPVPMYQWGKKP